MTLAMIRGSEVILIEGDTETAVRNVLIGSPGNSGCSYTLGIPKGDSHDWADRRLRFFGRDFRTIGIPETGEPENIPLDWGANIAVELLETTGSVTVYAHDTRKRQVYYDALCRDTRGETVKNTGSGPAGTLTVRLYSFALEDGYIPSPGDIIIDGETEEEIDTSTEQAESQSLAELRRKYPGFAVVRSVTAKLCGVKYDYDIEAV